MWPWPPKNGDPNQNDISCLEIQGNSNMAQKLTWEMASGARLHM